MNTLRKRITLTVLGGLALVGCANNAAAALVFADSAVVSDVSFFNSGILTGAPDGGGAFLSNTPDPPNLLGSITAGFSGGLADGPGVDIVIHDCCGGSLPQANELADVFVSTDGASFTLLGAYGGAAQVNSFDLNGVYAGVVNYVRIVNTGNVNSPDIDAFQGNYAAAAIPEPGTICFGFALLGACLGRRSRKAATVAHA